MSVFKLKTKQIMLSTVAAASIFMSACSDGTVRLGRLADANVKIFEISNNGKQVLKWEETTSKGNYLDEVGNFPSHDDDVDENKFYLIEIANGEDWDSNNDNIIDASSKHNNGKIRAIAKGDEIKEVTYHLSVTVASEIVYQLVKDDLKNFDIKTFQTKLDNAARKVLSYDLDGKSSVFNTQDYDIDNRDILVYNQFRNKSAITDKYYNDIDTFRNQIHEGKEIILDNKKIVKKKVEKLSTILNPTLIGSFDLKETWDITLSKDGTKVYIADGEKGLTILDISIPSNITLISSFALRPPSSKFCYYSYALTLSNDGTKAYIATGTDGLQVIDISNPKKPALIGSVDTNGFAWDIALSKDGTKAYIADGNKGLKMIDISNPKKPTLSRSLYLNEHISSITLSNDGTKAYLRATQKGLIVIDISKPTLLITMGSFDTKLPMDRIISSKYDTKAYLLDRKNGLKILDMTNPYNPTLLGSFNKHEYAVNIALSDDGKNAYLADGDGGLKIIDITNPKNITLLKSFDLNEFTYDIRLSNDGTKAYIMTHGGLKIIDLYSKKPIIVKAKTGVKLIGNPNPSIGDDEDRFKFNGKPNPNPYRRPLPVL